MIGLHEATIDHPAATTRTNQAAATAGPIPTKSWGQSGPVDTFAKDRLPPPDEWPEIDLSHPAYRYPARINCVAEFLDNWIEAGCGERTAFVTPAGSWSYRRLFETVNRMARVLVEDLSLVPGNRVLLRAANTPMMVAAYLAVIKAGGIAVGTMPLLRASELRLILATAEVSHALCDLRLEDELESARAAAPCLRHLAFWQSEAADGLEARMAMKPPIFEAFESAADEVCLIAFTSGTTGEPKGTVHFHRDMLAICDGFSRQLLRPSADDLFCGSPPLAFTFGLGGLALFPLREGAASLLLEQAAPAQLAEAIATFRPTICFTAPTAWRALAGLADQHDLGSLRKGVSAGEHLPKATFELVRAKLGLELIDGIGSTELLHIFIAAAGADIRPGATGRPVPGYQARIVDERGAEVAPGTVGRLAVKGPTGCRYLADDRQKDYVQGGWNLTGDSFRRDRDGYFWFEARADDMIISSGYNIAGPEVEGALLAHPAVAECAVVGRPDEERGQIVMAFVVAKPGVATGEALIQALQAHVKQTIAPYKYPRRIAFRERLPKTATGKLQRFKLRQEAAAAAGPT
jgi:2-aminobenzoate-CoA ligase